MSEKIRKRGEIPYRQVHLDFHTSEFVPDVAAEFDPEVFGDTLERAHVDSITCFGRCHHGWLYYPSKKFPELVHPNLKDKSLLIHQIDACHKRGIRVPIYTTVQWDKRVMEGHPEWLCRDENGAFIDTQHVPEPHFYYHICINSGYREFFKEHLIDMIQVVGPEKVDGIFMDILFHLDCCCDSCMKKMKQRGVDVTDKAERLKFSRQSLDEFKEEITALIHSMVPDATVFYNASNYAPVYKNSFKDYSHLEIESLPSGGWGYDHFPAISRYARMFGKETIGMTGKFHTYWGDFHSLKNRAALEFECFQMLAMGAGCSIGDQLHPSGKLSKGAYDLIGDVYASVEKKEPFCRHVKPRTEIGVLNPVEFYPKTSHDISVSPSLIGCVRILQEESYQFDVIDSDMDFSRYQVVILPDCIYGNEALEKKLTDYMKKGGHVLGSYESCLNKDGSSSIYGVRYQQESPFSREFVMPNDTIGKELPKEEFVMYLRGLDVEPDGAEVLMDKIEPYFERGGEKFCSHQHAPSSGKVGHPEVLRCGNAVYISHPVFRCYRKNAARWCKLIVRDALDLLLEDKLVSHDGPSTLITTLNRQEEENRDVLHLLHYITEKRSEDIYTIEDVIPLYALNLRVKTDCPVRDVSLALSGKSLDFTEEDGAIRFFVPKISGHEMICIKYK